MHSFATTVPPAATCSERTHLGVGVVCLAALLQFCLLAYAFPLSELFTDKPILFSDAAYHWYHMKLAVALARDGTLWAYDPFFAAGQPRGVFLDPSAHFPAALAALFSPRISEAVLYKMHAFASGWVAPLAVLAAARLLNVPRWPAIVAFTFALLLFWTSMFRWYYSHGMVSYVTAAYLALPFAALFYRCASGRSSVALLVGTGAFGAIAFFYHPLFPVLAAALIAPWLLLSFRNLAMGQALVALMVIPLLSLLPNLPWLAALREYQQAFPLGSFMADYQTRVDPAKIWEELFAMGEGCKVYAPIALLSLWNIVRGNEHASRRRLLIALMLAGASLVVFAAVGAAFPPFRSLQPNRFAPAGYLFLTVPAAYGLRRVWLAWSARATALRAVALVSAVAALVPAAYAAYEVAREVSYADIGHFGKKPPQVDGAGPYTVWLEDWIRENTDASARILFEVSLPRLYDGGRIPGYLALETGREFIGGPYPHIRGATFQKGYAFNRALTELPPQLFIDYLDLYNVGWIIANTTINKDYVDTVPGLEMVASYKEFTIYKVPRTPGFFLKGQGTISKREHNRLEVTDVTGEAVVLKYHYTKRLAIEPPAKMYPVKTDLDPVPFIGIDAPPRHFVLSIR